MQACFTVCVYYPQNDCHCLCRVRDVTDLGYPHFVRPLFIPCCLWCRSLTNDVFCLHFDLLHFTWASFLVRVVVPFFWVLELTLLIPAFLILFFWMKTNAGHKSRPEHGNHLMCNGIVPVPISPFFLLVYLLMPDLSLAVIPVFTHTHLSQPGPLPRRRIKLPNNTRSRVTSFSVCKQTWKNWAEKFVLSESYRSKF